MFNKVFSFSVEFAGDFVELFQNFIYFEIPAPEGPDDQKQNKND